MPSTNWADLNRDGRRLEGIIKMLNTKVHTISKNPNGDLNLMVSLAQTMVKFTHEKVIIAETVLGVKDIIKDIKAKPKPVYNEIH